MSTSDYPEWGCTRPLLAPPIEQFRDVLVSTDDEHVIAIVVLDDNPRTATHLSIATDFHPTVPVNESTLCDDGGAPYLDMASNKDGTIINHGAPRDKHLSMLRGIDGCILDGLSLIHI